MAVHRGTAFLVRASFVVGVTALTWLSVPAAVVGIAAMILVALHSKADLLIEISFGPLKAKLEREVTEAERLTGQLREFAALQARAVIQAGVRTGRWAGEDDWLFKQVKDLESSLRRMGVAEEALAEARRDFVTYTIWDAGNAALGQGTIPQIDGKYLEKEWREARGEFPYRDPDKIEAFLNAHGLMSEERAQRIVDMRWMLENGDVRDPEQYLRAHTGVPWTGP